MKFQWSKVASVLGSYRDFLHAYTMSLDSTNFSQGQIAAQLDTINRKYEQLKATMTGIATGIGASGLSQYIKNILSSLNAFAKSVQRIPTYVWKIIGGFVAVAAAIGTCIAVVKLFTAGMASLVTAQATYTAIVAGTTAATEGWAAATTAATGGLNILLGLLIAGAAAFLGYNAVISSNIEAINSEAQAVEDNVQVKRQEIEMSEKQGELIETLCNNHVKLQEALNTTKEGTEQHKRAEEDLAATDQALTAIIGEDAMKQIDWNGDIQASIKGLQDTHSKKTRKLRLELAQSLEAQASYQEAEQQRIEDTITNLSTEGTAWTKLGNIIERVLHSIGGAMVTMGEGIQSVGAKVKEVFPDMGGKLQDWGSSIMLSGINHQNFHSEWSDDRADNANEIAALKSQLAQSKVSSAKARAEADAIRSTGGTSNPYSNVSGGQEDSGIVTDSPAKGAKAGKGAGAGKGSGGREADNSPMAMSYRYLKAKGIDENFIAGLLGNAIRESGGWDLNPDADNGSHRGIFQWDYNDYSRTGRWYDFIDTFLKDRNISESQYYAMGKDQRRTLQLDFSLFEMFQGKERQAYQDIVNKDRPVTPEGWASAINQRYERSGESAGSPIDYERQSNARQVHSKYAGKNGEDNYTDLDAQTAKDYKLAKKLYEDKLETLTLEREKLGQGVSASEKKALFEETVNIKDFAILKDARKDYAKLIIDEIKQIRMRDKAIENATNTQVQAVEKMADAEVAFTEKLGLFNKQDVRNYQYRKNEQNYASKKPLLDYQLGNTVDLSKGTATDILKAYRGLIDAENELEAKHYANRIFWLSRDVDATKKALDEELKLEEKYQQERYRIERENFEYKNRYALNFIDSVSTEFSNGLNDMLTKAKSFGEALRDIFKNIGQSIIKEFTDDLGKRMKKWLSNLIFKRTDTGRALGTNHDKGKEHFNLMEWGMGNLSLLGGGKNGFSLLGGGKGNKGSNPFLQAMGLTPNLAQQAKSMITPVTYTLRNSVKSTFDTMQNYTSQGMNAITAGVQTGTQVMGMEWKGYKIAQVGTETAGNATIVANSQSTAATVQATTAQMMGWIMAVLALFSLFGGGGGSSTTESHDSVNLGRSPDSYYMTPSAVMQSTTFQVPSFDIGGNIEQDMFAMVHKGEMVLTPEQAEVIRNSARSNGSMGNGGANANVKSNITVTTVSSRGFEQVLRDYNRDLSKNVKKGIRNGYLTAKGLV